MTLMEFSMQAAAYYTPPAASLAESPAMREMMIGVEAMPSMPLCVLDSDRGGISFETVI